MSEKLTRSAYTKLIADDVQWLLTMPRTLERDHILLILEKAVEDEYGPEEPRERSVNRD